MYSLSSTLLMIFLPRFLKVRIMKKRLVRKAFEMILGISLSDNKEVLDYITLFLVLLHFLVSWVAIVICFGCLPDHS